MHVIGAARQPAGSPSTPSDNNNGKDSNYVPEEEGRNLISTLNLCSSFIQEQILQSSFHIQF